MCVFWMQNSNLWTGITSLYGSQTWPFVLCMYDSVISTRITRLYGFQPSSVVFGCKTATYGPEQQVSMSPRHNLSFCACKTAWFAPEWQVYMGSSPHLCFFSCKTRSLWPDLQVCMGPRPHLWFLHTNQQLLDQNCMSLWVLELTCDFLNAKQLA